MRECLWVLGWILHLGSGRLVWVSGGVGGYMIGMYVVEQEEEGGG